MDSVILFIKNNAWLFPALALGIGWARYYLKTHDIERRYEDCKNERDKCCQVRAALEEELGRLKSVSVFKHWLYLPSDGPPRTLICHRCYGDGPPRRMEAVYTHYVSAHKDVDTSPTLAFICHHCDSKFETGSDKEAIEKIMNE